MRSLTATLVILAALAAASAAGADPVALLPAFAGFASARRRMERIGQARDVTVYDDFAHHPTAIATTLAGLRASVGAARIVVALEPRSNSMRLGAHADALAPSLADADRVVFLHRPELPWDAGKVVDALDGPSGTTPDFTCPFPMWGEGRDRKTTTNANPLVACSRRPDFRLNSCLRS